MDTRTFARTILSIIAILIIFLIISVIPTVGDTVYNTIMIKFVGKIDLCKNWSSILLKDIDWDAMTNSTDGVIVKPSGVLKELGSEPSGTMLFFGFLAVASKSLLEAIITGACSAIFKNILRDWILLSNALGIIVGLLICLWLSNMGGSTALMSVLYSLVPIAVLGIGVATVWNSTNVYNRNRGKKKRRKFSKNLWFFLVNIICGVITALASTMYLSTLCLVAGRKISRIAAVISSFVYIVILLLDYIRLRYRELKAERTHNIGWRNFIPWWPIK